ncbi:MAG: branched-chain amino acid ABC transporter substrate-binding protein [Gaiellaceae bacterium]
MTAVLALACLAGGAAIAGNAAPSASVPCKNARVALLAPLTGPAASVGKEQLHWAQYAVFLNNKTRGATKISLSQYDTQLDAAQAASQALKVAASNRVLAVAGPAVSDEVSAVGATFDQNRLAFVSGSATRTALTIGANKVPTFFRTVGTDFAQSTTDADFIRNGLHAARVWIVDDQTDYSVALADRVERLLRQAGVTVTRDSVYQTTTDFSLLLSDAPRDAQVVFVPWLLGSRATTFLKQYRAKGLASIFVGTDKLDGPDWLAAAEGQYFSSFADVKQLRSKYVSNVVRGYVSKYGDFKSTFGPPTFVAVQVAAAAIKTACKDGKASRAEVLAATQKTDLQTTVLGYGIRFRGGDPAKARFYVYKVSGGKRHLVE